jgi:predicted RNA methylase
MIVNIIAFLILVSIIYAWSSLAPWAPTPIKDLERINKIANLKSGQVFVELGSGNGRVCSYIAKKNPSAKVIGIELAFLFYIFTKIKVLILGPRNLKIVFGDALKYDISKADIVYVYVLTKGLNGEIKKKILKEMQKKAKLISYVFPITEWSGNKKTHNQSGKASNIHVYEMS